MKLKYLPGKNPQKQEEFSRGGGRIFLAGQNMYPWSSHNFPKLVIRSASSRWTEAGRLMPHSALVRGIQTDWRSYEPCQCLLNGLSKAHLKCLFKALDPRIKYRRNTVSNGEKFQYNEFFVMMIRPLQNSILAPTRRAYVTSNTFFSPSDPFWRRPTQRAGRQEEGYRCSGSQAPKGRVHVFYIRELDNPPLGESTSFFWVGPPLLKTLGAHFHPFSCFVWWSFVGWENYCYI